VSFLQPLSFAYLFVQHQGFLMADTPTAAATQAAEAATFNVARVYLKDLSLELPGAPEIFLEQGQPGTEVELQVATRNLNNGHFEVTTTATVTTKVGDKVLFLVEGTQGGIFEIRGVPDDQLEPLLEIVCAGIVYPYLRANVADAVTRASLPPVHLTEVNFQAFYEAKKNAAAQQQPDTAKLQ
jgi:preprotein translocase subunit SecB